MARAAVDQPQSGGGGVGGGEGAGGGAGDASWTPARYDFNYAVNDPLTGDLKDQQETRSGDDVAGFYRTLDADGLVRTVRYQADAVNGFRAEVVREPAPPGGGAVVDDDLVAKAAVVPAAYHPAAYYRGLSPAHPYQPYATAAYRPYQLPYQPYRPYAAYHRHPYSSRARLLQPYAAYHRHPYSPYLLQTFDGLRL